MKRLRACFCSSLRLFLVLCLLFQTLFLTSGCSSDYAGLLRVDDVSITASKARIYLALVARQYEEKAGEDIWSMELESKPAWDTACDAALSSLIRNQVVLNHLRPSQTMVSEEEEEKIRTACAAVRNSLGSDVIESWGIDNDTLYTYMLEDFCVSQYISEMSFIVDEAEIDRKMEEYFVWYDHLDASEYMKKVILDAIIIYTGQYIDGEWVSFSEDVREEQRVKAQNAAAFLESGYAFSMVKEALNEEPVQGDSPMFRQGLVVNTGSHAMYKGQMDRDLWEPVFKIPLGGYSGAIPCQFGYVIVHVTTYPADGTEEEYQEKLSQLKEEYRERLYESYSGTGINQIIDEWERETTITLNQNLWKEITDSMRPKS